MTSMQNSIADWDASDPLAPCRALFHLPVGVVYLDGNSLGALPIAVTQRILEVTQHEWGDGLIRSWLDVDWLNLPARVGAKIARLIGAAAQEVVAADSTSINLYKCLTAAVRLRPGRNVILTEQDNFPTDLYIVDSIAMQLGLMVRRVPADEVVDNMDDNVAAVALTHVNYKTARMHDLRHVTAAAHAVGALAVWDLAHSAGAVPCDLNEAKADFAVGCGYKYLNGGPGAPAFVFAASRHHLAARQPLTGWLGHRNPFAFDQRYESAVGMGQFLCGTPAILSLSSLDAALDLFDTVSLHELRAKSRRMTDVFVDLFEAKLAGRGFTLCCERDGSRRGSHVAISHPQGETIMGALAARGIIGDFRPPDIMRFGFAPLYNRYADVLTLVDGIIAEA